jgi:hypothetical protein
VPPEWRDRPELLQDARWLLECYRDLRRSVSGDHPVGIEHVTRWLDLQGIEDDAMRRRAWSVVRSVDEWQMQRWADEREQRRKGGNVGEG